LPYAFDGIAGDRGRLFGSTCDAEQQPLCGAELLTLRAEHPSQQILDLQLRTFASELLDLQLCA
jgi:hypothetical protein